MVNGEKGAGKDRPNGYWKPLLAVCGLCYLLFLGWLLLKESPAPPVPENSGSGTKTPKKDASLLFGPPHEILPGSGLYYLGAHEETDTASYALNISGGVIVIDPGSSFSHLQGWFEALDLNFENVKIILLTHLHADHWFATRQLVEQSGAVVMAHEREVPLLQKPGDLGVYFTNHSPSIQKVPVIKNVRALKDGEIVELGDARIEVIATPGHTPGSACYRFEVRGRQVLWTGDMVMTLGKSPFGGDYVTRLGPRYGGDMKSYLASLERLQSIPVEVVLPGHPGNGSSLRAVIGVAEWNALLQPTVSKLKNWLDLGPEQAGLFLDGKPKSLDKEVLYLGEFQSTAAYVLQTSQGSIFVDPGRRKVEDIFSVMTELGAKAEDLKIVLISTPHPDHAASAPELCRQTGAKLFTGPMPPEPPWDGEFRPNRILNHGDQFQLGDFVVIARSGPYGSGIDMSYFIQTPSRNIVIGGDNIGRFPFRPGEERHTLIKGGPEETKQAPDEFYQFLKEQFVQMVLPAHPRFDESPIYFPGEWKPVVAKWERLVEPLRMYRKMKAALKRQ